VPAPKAPATRPRKSGVAAPRRRAPAAAPSARRRTALALGRFVEARLLDRLVRGRLWVVCVGALLAGIVFLNVSLLQLNQEIARTTTHATALDRQNSGLRARVAAVDSSERLQRLAEARGMVMPAPGQYRYLRARPWLDAELAARKVVAPSPATPTVAAVPTTSTPTATTAPTATATATPTTTTTTPTASAEPTPQTAATTTPPTAVATP
jgi:cell division protein FtsL